MGGQYKYKGWTINFPEQVKDVTMALPWHIKDFYLMIIAWQKGQQGPCYDFIVIK